MEIDAHRACIVMLLSSYNEYTRRFVFAADIFVYELPLDVFEIAEFSYYAKTISARVLVATKHVRLSVWWRARRLSLNVAKTFKMFSLMAALNVFITI